MQYDPFIDHIAETLDVPRDEAEHAAEVVLGTLGEALYRTERDALGAELPKPADQHLFSIQPRETTPGDRQTMELDALYTRVASRTEGRSTAGAQMTTSVVLGAVQEAVSDATLRKVFDTLPSSYATLLPAGRDA
jgi:uncharacterized protein (DUF2267 family)